MIANNQQHRHHLNASANRTVYLGNVPNDLSISDIIDHVKTGPIQAIRPLLEKNGLFITFIDSYAANQFYLQAQRNRLTIHGHEFKIGWGKPSLLNPHLQSALQYGVSRNVYLGLLDESIVEQNLRDELSRFGHVEHVKIIPERRIAFVHFLCISNAVKCVNVLSCESKWQSRRVNFGKDRCAPRTVHPTIYQHPMFHTMQSPLLPPLPSCTSMPSAALLSPQFDLLTGLPLIYDHHIDHNFGGVANRTIFLGNIHPDSTAEDICNVIRGGILSQIRFIPDKHIAFVTFVDPNAASLFLNQALYYSIAIKSRRLKIGWGKPAALPLNVIYAVQNGGSRNVYVGGIDHTITEEKLKHDFSRYGNIELVNTLKKKNCAFVNFTSIAEAVRAIEGVKSNQEYKRFHINFGKDRCGKAPRLYQTYSKSSITEGDIDHENQDENHQENTSIANVTESNLTL